MHNSKPWTPIELALAVLPKSLLCPLEMKGIMDSAVSSFRLIHINGGSTLNTSCKLAIYSLVGLLASCRRSPDLEQFVRIRPNSTEPKLVETPCPYDTFLQERFSVVNTLWVLTDSNVNYVCMYVCTVIWSLQNLTEWLIDWLIDLIRRRTGLIADAVQSLEQCSTVRILATSLKTHEAVERQRLSTSWRRRGRPASILTTLLPLLGLDLGWRRHWRGGSAQHDKKNNWPDENHRNLTTTVCFHPTCKQPFPLEEEYWGTCNVQ